MLMVISTRSSCGLHFAQVFSTRGSFTLPHMVSAMISNAHVHAHNSQPPPKKSFTSMSYAPRLQSSTVLQYHVPAFARPPYPPSTPLRPQTSKAQRANNSSPHLMSSSVAARRVS